MQEEIHSDIIRMLFDRTNWKNDDCISRRRRAETTVRTQELNKIVNFHVFLHLRTVVKVTVGKSQALYSSFSRKSKDKNSGLLTVGAVNVDIPQHPVALHGMVTRGSKQLSSTLQELRVTRTSSRLSKGQQFDEEQTQAYSPNNNLKKNIPLAPTTFQRTNLTEQGLLQPLVMQFSVILQSLSITAALLPSLQAQYKMDQVTSTGVTGSKAKFTIDLPHHSLSFTTKFHVRFVLFIFLTPSLYKMVLLLGHRSEFTIRSKHCATSCTRDS